MELDGNGGVAGVRTFFGVTFRCRAAVLTTGTFMNGRIWVGRASHARWAVRRVECRGKNLRVRQSKKYP